MVEFSVKNSSQLARMSTQEIKVWNLELKKVN